MRQYGEWRIEEGDHVLLVNLAVVTTSSEYTQKNR